MAVKNGSPASKERTDPAAIAINGMTVTAMIIGTVAAVLMLAAGAFYRSDWMIMLAVCFTLSVFARGFLILPVKKVRKTKARIARGYERYRITGLTLTVLYLILLLFVIIKRKEGFFYPLPVLILTLFFAAYKIASLVLNQRAYGDVDGPYTAGLRLMDIGEAAFALLLIVHAVMAIIDRTYVAAGFIWIATAIVMVLLLAASVYMVIFAGNEIRYYSA